MSTIAVQHTSDMGKLGELIRNRRYQLGMTQQELADQIGIRASYISQIETNDRKWPHEHVPALSAVLGLSQVDMAIAAGLIERVGPTPTPDPDPVRADLLRQLGRVRLDRDRVDTLQDILGGWLARDRRPSEHLVKERFVEGDAPIARLTERLPPDEVNDPIRKDHR